MIECQSNYRRIADTLRYIEMDLLLAIHCRK